MCSIIVGSIVFRAIVGSLAVVGCLAIVETPNVVGSLVVESIVGSLARLAFTSLVNEIVNKMHLNIVQGLDAHAVAY